MKMKCMKYPRSNLVVEEEWKHKKPMFKDNNYGELFQWPASCKNYTCSFCKREFKSAQALGGHMNVHRRERARLRQLPSWIFQLHNPKPSSEPNPTIRHYSPFPPSSSTLLSTMDHQNRIDSGDEGGENAVREEGKHLLLKDEIAKREKFAKLDLKMGFEKEASDSNLDLELRLGNL